MFWEYDSRTGRRWNIDPVKRHYESSYLTFGGNPIFNIDVKGDDWFHYQSKGETEKTWHYNEGKKAKYEDVNGKMRTTRKGFETIAFYEKTGTNLYGAYVGKITLYKQNEVISEQTNVFSGSGWWGTGENPYKGGFDAAPNGNYLMYLNLRNDEGPKKMNSEDSNPEPYFGIQKIPENTTLLRKDGSKYDLNRDYGNSRVRLNPVDDNFVYQANQDRGYYLHGKGAFYNRTHGCVCDKSEKIFNALWELDKNVNGDGKVPFVIGIPYKK